MSTAEKKDAAAIASYGSSDLFGQTLRTVAILVGACVLFVGALSTAAVLVTSKAVGPSDRDTTTVKELGSASPKKPVSI